MHLKILFTNWQPFCLGLNVLTTSWEVLLTEGQPAYWIHATQSQIEIALITYISKMDGDVKKNIYVIFKLPHKHFPVAQGIWAYRELLSSAIAVT